MGDYNLEDYSGIGMLGGLVKGAAQGLMQGEEMADRREDRKLKKLEFESKMAAEKIATEKKTNEDNFAKAGKLRDDWLKNPTTKNSQTIKEAHDKIRGAAASPSAAGDMSLIFGYMKMLDPGSTVREGEFANAQNATGVPSQIANLYNRIQTGERLNPQQRADFLRQAQNVFNAQQKSQGTFDEQFGGLADTYNIPRGEVVLKIFTDPQTGEKKTVEVPAEQGLVQQQPKPKVKAKGLIGGGQKQQQQAPVKIDYDKMSDKELERLYKQKMGGG